MQRPMVILVGLPHQDGEKILQAVGDSTIVVMATSEDEARAMIARPVRIQRLAHRMVEYAGLSIDLDRRTVEWCGRSLRLPGRELDLLAVLADDPGRVWSVARLTEQVWGRAYIGDRSAVVSAVKRLRAHLREDRVALRIESVRGRGYRLALV